MTKSEIRAQIAEQRKSLPCLEQTGRTVLKKLLELEIFRQAKSVGVYMPLPDEVDVRPLFGCSDGEGGAPDEPLKQFFIPAFDETLGSYRMARYTPELKPGRFGIPEPEHPVWSAPGEIDLILVPGIAFDRAGGRLGRGGGFYDRLLPLYCAQRLGLGFGFQILDALPTEEHDIRMGALLTEEGFLNLTTNIRQVRRSELC